MPKLGTVDSGANKKWKGERRKRFLEVASRMNASIIKARDIRSLRRRSAWCPGASWRRGPWQLHRGILLVTLKGFSGLDLVFTPHQEPCPAGCSLGREELSRRHLGRMGRLQRQCHLGLQQQQVLPECRACALQGNLQPLICGALGAQEVRQALYRRQFLWGNVGSRPTAPSKFSRNLSEAPSLSSWTAAHLPATPELLHTEPASCSS